MRIVPRCKMEKNALLLSALLSIIFAVEGCGTVRGIGEDIQSLGRTIKRSVSG
jgi:predicted small secreted protein